jgi:hypothetical protein
MHLNTLGQKPPHQGLFCGKAAYHGKRKVPLTYVDAVAYTLSSFFHRAQTTLIAE